LPYSFGDENTYIFPLPLMKNSRILLCL